MNLYKYRYSHAAAFLKQRGNPAALSNFRGEIYEAAFYEYLVALSSSDASPVAKLISKGIYTPKNNGFVKQGFYCDAKGQCIYNSHGLSVAEFDAIILSDSGLTFYECTLTQKPENLRTLKSEALRKYSLMQRLFPGYTIACTVVGDNPVTLEPFESIEGFTTMLFDFPAIDPLDVAKNAAPQAHAPTYAMRSANSLNKQTLEYDCLADFGLVSQRLFAQTKITSIKEDLLAANGLIQRLCWGKINAAQLESRLGTLKAEFVYVLISFKNVNTPRIRFYYFDQYSRDIFEATSPPKKLTHRKVSRLELASVRKEAPVRDVSDFLALEDDVAKWASP
ncbi:hypothetical protein ACIPO9_06170 [Pseudomonas sp. NPDC090203]|uniref:hypothetical protein n=1 Tax=Pseudomonas sp. NPDC090203 TaxID=3364477 RepID=UPI003814E883